MTTSAISRMGRSPEEGIKAPVLTSTTTNITLFGTGQILNGITTGTGDRVLVKDQTLDSENGIYDVGPDDWERTTDMNAADDVDNGQLVVDSNTSVIYSIVLLTVWSPDASDINFVVLVGAMPGSIVLTSSNAIDLVDTDVALNTGALDPDTEQHLEYDFDTIQSKSNATTAADLNLNPLGGDVIAAGISITAHAAAFVAHAADATIHFTQAAISITASQVSDFDTEVANNADVVANTAKVTNATHTGQVLGDTALTLDVTAITDQPGAGAVVGADTMIINDGGVLSEVTAAQLATFFAGAAVHSLISDADGDTRIQVEEAADEDIIRFDLGDNVTGYPALADALLFSAGQFTLALPTANVATTVGAPISLTTGAGNTTGDGGAFNILTGDGGAVAQPGGDFIVQVGTGAGTGASGNVFINTITGIGPQGGSVDSSEAPGLVSIYGVNSSGNIQAGNVEIWGGYSTGVAPAQGGDVMLFGGGGGGGPPIGGDVCLWGGDADVTPGEVHLTGGTATVGGDGGDVNIDGGPGFGSGTRDGGDVNITGGLGIDAGDGGAVAVHGGDAGATGNGALLDLKGGDATTGIGGICTLRGGNVITSGVGGRMQLLGGQGGTVSDVGGSVWMIAGQGGANDGAAGDVFINSSTGAGATGGSLVVEGGEAVGLVSIYGVGTLDDNLAGNVEIWGGYANGTGAGAVGGELVLTGGEGGATAGFGGDLVLAGGGGDSPGAIRIPDLGPPPATANRLYSIAGKLNWNGAPVLGFTVVTETTTSRTAVAFECVLVDDDTAAGTVTVTLPPSVLNDQIVVKKLGTTADVILDGDSAEEIDGETTFTLTSQYASITLIADGTGWNII